jgi:hypothetical protein
MAQERDIAFGVMSIAGGQQSGICTFRRAFAEIPQHVGLSARNLAASATRPGEPMWHQLVRNIKSHDAASGNFIADGYLEHVPRVGYRITPAGRALLQRLRR